ncbi:MAG: hypothetical protein Q9182_004264 [Xanthomendoza sp. 2 TL-2023]
MASPSRSPRLPSPPPFPEVQIGPQSPTGRIVPGSSTQEHDDTARYDQSASRRIRPGTRATDMAAGPPLVPLSEIDSSFQLQEHLKALYNSYTRPAQDCTSAPINAESAHALAKGPEGVDPLLWLLELCRLLVIKTNDILVAFFNESPPCSKDTCPEMRASEWQYLCAVHDPPKACCAIDYCNHTLNWSGDQIASPKNFPSRLTLGSQSTGGSQGGLRILTNIMRRCYRIYAHSWFQHRQVFWNIENSLGHYIFFKTVCDVYNLIPQDSYTIPSDAEGIAAAEDESRDFDRSTNSGPEEPEATTTISTGATTRRHKHTPSTGSAVTTITEGREEEDDDDDDDDEQHSPDKGIPLDVLSSSALKASATSILSKGPATENIQVAEPDQERIEDAPSSDSSMDVKDVKDVENLIPAKEGGEESEADTVVQGP